MNNESFGSVVPATGGVAKRGKRNKRTSLFAPFASGSTPTPRLQIGTILVRDGKMAAEDADRVHQHQSEQQLRFGEAAVRLRLVSDEDVQQALALQFDYPFLTANDESINPEVVAAFRPFDPRVEAFRALRAQIVLRWLSVGGGGRAFAVIGPGRRDGRSYLAANLAVVFAQLGTRTILIDADMRRPRQHELFKVSNKSGLSQILAGRGDPESIQSVPQFRNLSVIPSGSLPPNPQELLVRPAFQDLLDELSDEYRVIIVDTPAGVNGADVQFISRSTRAALMVIRQNHTRVKPATRFTQELGPTGVTVLGTVLNRF